MSDETRSADDTEAELGRLARRKSGVFTRAEAVAAGVPLAEIRDRIRSGLWVPELGRGIRAATTPVTVESREHAALVRAGDGCALSHFSAARRWRLGTADPNDVWVTVPRGRNPRSTGGMRVVRSRHVPDSVVRNLDGVPVLSAARTVADLARYVDERRLAAIAFTAMQSDLCTHAELQHWYQVLRGRPGSALLARALQTADPAFESILAAEFGQLIGAAGVSLVPSLELVLPDGGRVICDFADPSARIDFEIDGLAYHGTPDQIARDRTRDRRLLAAGWVTVRYDTNDVRRRPRATLADVLRHIARRRP